MKLLRNNEVLRNNAVPQTKMIGIYQVYQVCEENSKNIRDIWEDPARVQICLLLQEALDNLA